jgi:hypothetical protein
MVFSEECRSLSYRSKFIDPRHLTTGVAQSVHSEKNLVTSAGIEAIWNQSEIF